MTYAICVFCGSQTGNDSSYVEAADSLGREIAVRGIDLIYGGGDLGLMGAVSAGVTELGGNKIGIIPEFIASRLPSTTMTSSKDLALHKLYKILLLGTPVLYKYLGI